ncbi:MAG TPA: response regulator [Chitinispirillaceae bacterium]|nr:response regulator [Chitinispirillaceae bacterium]
MNESEKPLVVVCDDNEMVVELISHKLMRSGYRVAQAFDGETALDIALTGKPAVLILDIMMPGLDGLEVVRKMKSNPVTQHIPVVIVSSKRLEKDVISGLSLGVDEYLVKPFSPEELITRIGRLVKKKIV